MGRRTNKRLVGEDRAYSKVASLFNFFLLLDRRGAWQLPTRLCLCRSTRLCSVPAAAAIAQSALDSVCLTCTVNIMFSQAMRNASRSILLSQRRTFLTCTSPLLKDLPYHLVMGLPALSPTMETGALAEWYVKEGDKFSAGDVSNKRSADMDRLAGSIINFRFSSFPRSCLTLQGQKIPCRTADHGNHVI